MTGTERTPAAVSLVLLLSMILFQSSLAFFGDGSLELSWSGLESVEDGTSVLSRNPNANTMSPLSREGLTLALIGPGAERRISLSSTDVSGASMPDLAPGLFQLQLRLPDGSALGEWTLLVRSEAKTTAHLDFALSRITIDALSGEPFGNEEVWTPEELSVLPGVGDEMLEGLDTHGDARSMWLDGTAVGSRARPELTQFRIDRGLLGVQSPLGLRSAAFRSADRRLLTRPTSMTRFALHGTGGTSSRVAGTGAVGYRGTSGGFGPIDVQVQAQWLRNDDAGPYGVADDALDHNDLESIETNGFVQAHPFGNPLRLQLYARGASRNHYLQEFALDLPHSALEDRAHLHATGGYDFRILSLPWSVALEYQRDFVETGDGENFDVFERYSRNPSLPDYTTDGLYWAPDEPATAVDEGRQFDYYYRSLLAVVTLRAESRVSWSDASGDGVQAVSATGNTVSLLPLRLGTELAFPRWHLFEHLAPSQAATGAESGYQMTRNFGYSQDGDEQASQAGHETAEPSELALYATQRIRFPRLELEGGVRWQRFSPGQAPLANLEDPLGGDDQLDKGAEETDAFLVPRIGFHSRLGARTHLWIDGGRTLESPPYEAVYYDEDLLALQAGLTSQAERFGRDFVFGNPALLPESRWSGHLGLAHEITRSISVRVGGHTARTSDTWVARSVPVGDDQLAFYDNEGERRESGLHASTRWKTSSTTELRVFYDLARVETNVIEPTPLYRGLLAPDDPVQNIASVQTALPTSLWLEDGIDRGFFPSQRDRTHRFSASWGAAISPATFGFSGIAEPSRLAVVVRAASGRPYTTTYFRKEGAMDDATRPAEIVSLTDINGKRMPGTWQLDVGVEQPLLLLGRKARARLEVRNVTNNENVTRVYGATGEPDDDGWIESLEGQAEVASRGDAYADAYRARIDNPRHFDAGIAARIALTVDF